MAGVVLRFVTSATHPPYGHRSGVIAAAYALRASPPDPAACLEGIAEHLEWFEGNLARPPRLSTSRHPRAAGTALSWIRSDALGHVGRLRALAALVREAGGTAVHEMRTARPGYVVFEDGHQVVALPFADTPR